MATVDAYIWLQWWVWLSLYMVFHLCAGSNGTKISISYSKVSTNKGVWVQLINETFKSVYYMYIHSVCHWGVTVHLQINELVYVIQVLHPFKMYMYMYNVSFFEQTSILCVDRFNTQSRILTHLGQLPLAHDKTPLSSFAHLKNTHVAI